MSAEGESVYTRISQAKGQRNVYHENHVFMIPFLMSEVDSSDFFIYVSSDENTVLTQIFEENRDNVRKSQSAFLIVKKVADQTQEDGQKDGNC